MDIDCIQNSNIWGNILTLLWILTIKGIDLLMVELGHAYLKIMNSFIITKITSNVLVQ